MAFTHPWFLLGLLGIVIPIAIHLFELRRPQRVLFSNVEFIREIKLITARQRKLKHLLVLAARIGFVASVTLLFAQPFIPAPDSGSSNDTSGIGVLLDSSPSMRQVASDEQPLLEQAIREAGELPLAFPATAHFQLWPSNKAVAAAGYRVSVEETSVSGQAPKLAQAILQSQNGRASGPQFVFSDFQKSGFDPVIIRQLDSIRQVFLVPLAGVPTANVFVDSVWLDDAFVRVGVDVVLHVRLRNGGGVGADDCQAKLFIGNQQAAAFRATIPAQKAITTQVKVRLTEATTQLCRVQVEDFPIDFDNTYYFTLQPARQIQVVEVSEQPRLREVYGNEPLFAYQHIHPQATNYRNIAAAQLLIVREAVSLPSGLRESLRSAVQQGATVVVVPAPSVASRDAYSLLLRQLGVGPVQWQPVAKAGPVLQEVATPSAQNPFFQEVFAGVNQRAGMPKAAPTLRWTRSGTEVLRMRDGESYLAGFPSGDGITYVFSAPFSSPYSDLAQHPLFVPILYRLAMQSYQQEQQPAYRLNQAVVSLRLPKSTEPRVTEPIYRLVQDSLTYIPVQRQQGTTLRFDVPPNLGQPGFYTLERAGQAVATLAFNFDKRESDLRSYSAAELRQLIGPNRPNIHVYETGQGQTAAAQYKATQVGVPLWRYCLWAALACLLVEALLLRFNRTQTAPQLAMVG